jgi:hypothetical protein
MKIDNGYWWYKYFHTDEQLVLVEDGWVFFFKSHGRFDIEDVTRVGRFLTKVIKPEFLIKE